VVGLLLSLCGQLGHPVTDHIFRPLNDAKNGSKPTGYSTPALSHMVKHQLEAVGLSNGETNHSYRCGSLQALERAARTCTPRSEKVQMAGRQVWIETLTAILEELGATGKRIPSQ
jgi:hypothetical protein